MLKEVCLASGCPRSTCGRSASQASVAAVRQLTSKLPDVAGAHQQDQVPPPHQVVQSIPDGGEVGGEAGLAHLERQVLPGELARVLLTGRVDVGDEHGVGAVEAGREL